MERRCTGCGRAHYFAQEMAKPEFRVLCVRGRVHMQKSFWGMRRVWRCVQCMRAGAHADSSSAGSRRVNRKKRSRLWDVQKRVGSGAPSFTSGSLMRFVPMKAVGSWQGEMVGKMEVGSAGWRAGDARKRQRRSENEQAAAPIHESECVLSAQTKKGEGEELPLSLAICARCSQCSRSP